jgi:hypothetical protein
LDLSGAGCRHGRQLGYKDFQTGLIFLINRIQPLTGSSETVSMLVLFATYFAK